MRIRFGPFTLDPGTRQLTAARRRDSPRAEGVRTAARAGLRASKSSLQGGAATTALAETFVAEANLSNLVAEIREALGDRAACAAWIRTAHGFGYAFCGDAVTAPRLRRSGSDRPAVLARMGRPALSAVSGEHVIGRDPDVEVRLDASTVSRRHARLVVTAERHVLEDFGSKNGTFAAASASRRRCSSPTAMPSASDRCS